VSAHYIVLVVALPLLAAPCCVLLGRRSLARLLAIVVAGCCFGMACSLLSTVLATGPLSYALGGWEPPLGIEYRLDLLNAYVLLIVSGVGAVVMPYGVGTWGLSIPDSRESLFYAAFLLALCGLMGIVVTGDAFNVFVFVEITSLSSYALIAMGRGRRALTAAFSYLVMGTIGGTFLLIGIGMLYLETGTLNMLDIADRLQHTVGSRTSLVAFSFLFVGGGIKLALFPLHHWLPNAYTFAPAVISAFLAATATKVAYYVLVRVIFTLFGATFIFETLHFHRVLLPLSLVAMFVGSLAAIFQTNLKRLLAYSSVAQIGYMTLGLSFASQTGLTGGLVHLFNHALMKGGLFLVAGCVMYRIASNRIEDLAGLGRRMPFTMAAFVVGGLSLIGVPGTVGFVSKWYLVIAALEKGWYVVAFLILLSSLLAAVYIWRVVEVIFFRAPSEVSAGASDPPLSMLIPTWLLIGSTIVFGLQTEWSAGVASRVAAWLMGGGA
jgi:multicomponent Na+:H+ antiporter subunit D